MSNVTFKVEMKPVGKARPRMGKHGVYTPTKTIDAEKVIRQAATVAMAGRDPYGCPVVVVVLSEFAVPKSYSKKDRAMCLAGEYIPGKPDADNVAKLVLDAMNGIVYVDDVQCALLVAGKKYMGQDGIYVSVAPLTSEPVIPEGWLSAKARQVL